MPWLAVDKDGCEGLYNEEPDRDDPDRWCQCDFSPLDPEDFMFIELPSGSIEKMIGRKLTWEDEPVELKNE